MTGWEERACGLGKVELPRPRPVTVNGVTISRGEIARETQNHPARRPFEAWSAAARALVIRELLLQEARRLCLTPEPITDGEGRRETPEEAVIRQLLAHAVEAPAVSDAECRRVYESQHTRFRSPALSEVRHILFAAPPDDAAARIEARAKAEVVIAELETTPQRFPALAAAVSACPSGKTGGSLGQIGPGMTVPEFEAAIETAPIGRVVPQPVETRYGYHVVIVDRRIEARELPFEAVRERILAWLEERGRRLAAKRYLAGLVARAVIEGIDLAVPTEVAAGEGNAA